MLIVNSQLTESQPNKAVTCIFHLSIYLPPVPLTTAVQPTACCDAESFHVRERSGVVHAVGTVTVLDFLHAHRLPIPASLIWPPKRPPRQLRGTHALLSLLSHTHTSWHASIGTPHTPHSSFRVPFARLRLNARGAHFPLRRRWVPKPRKERMPPLFVARTSRSSCFTP